MNLLALARTNPFRNAPADLQPLEQGDARALSRLHASAFPLAGRSWGAGEFHGLLASPGVSGHRAVRASALGRPEPRGFVLVRTAADEAEVLTLAVHPSWQGRGIGRSLMNAAIRDLYAARVARLHLEVDEGNAPAIALYDRLGFRRVGTRKAYYAGGEGREGGANAVTMALALDE